MKRRKLITLLGGAIAWPIAARAQRSEGMKRIGVLMGPAAGDQALDARLAEFVQGLEQYGWAVGRNLQIEVRWSAGDAERIRSNAAELTALAPDVVVASGSAAIAALTQATRTVPLMFINVIDPVGAGFVDSLARPGGNVTGFVAFEYGIAAKWLELLKEIMPSVKRVAILRDAAISAGTGQFAAIQTAAPRFRVEVSPVNVRDRTEIERDVTAFARSPNGGMIVTGSALAATHHDLIIALAARHKLPAIYASPYWAAAGGLAAYGPNISQQYRSAAGYVDRILRGEKPADLAVQVPSKYELVVNMKTAAALGLTVPQSLLARADEVIE
jgi:putative tryptophan/tyrosine transport system substrate-binding protein